MHCIFLGDSARTALWLMGIRPACLEPLALSASGHERMVNGRAAASGEKRIDLPEENAWFGDILNIDAPLAEIGPRSFFVNQVVGGRQRRSRIPSTLKVSHVRIIT